MNGNGVLAGLTEISDVCGTKSVDGKKLPMDGKLYYQGYEVGDLISNFRGERFRFEEVTYLLLFGELPSQPQLEGFVRVLSDLQELSGSFVSDVIMKATNNNIMNSLMKSILALYSYDEAPDDTSVTNVLRQSLQLIAKMPLIAAYGFHSYRHIHHDDTLFIRTPQKGLSTAENI